VARDSTVDNNAEDNTAYAYNGEGTSGNDVRLGQVAGGVRLGVKNNARGNSAGATYDAVSGNRARVRRTENDGVGYSGGYYC